MNSKEEQTNSEVTNLENESYVEKKKDANYTNEQTARQTQNQQTRLLLPAQPLPQQFRLPAHSGCLLYTSPSPRD